MYHLLLFFRSCLCYYTTVDPIFKKQNNNKHVNTLLLPFISRQACDKRFCCFFFCRVFVCESELFPSLYNTSTFALEFSFSAFSSLTASSLSAHKKKIQKSYWDKKEMNVYSGIQRRERERDLLMIIRFFFLAYRIWKLVYLAHTWSSDVDETMRSDGMG